ncbi:autophagy-related protein 13a-like [Actinidia eriantha]|uniref:autophagy-related protein 13a-like n=1 Tax=Actinidia eriantha TaxID=165200 RepID=UPI002589FC5A|nr:autophagy-related protein 13a-like [Actinidia eriantha]XP_057464074.1 autophagy-related protein 13a-like [Actinidia eriantha]XP_057464075.1 autophagy-related protein 13a-like [Actinidia eriantha]
MDLQGNVQVEYGRFEQIVSQFLSKSLHIILDSRVPSIRPLGRSGDLLLSAPVKKSDKWFNLVLGDRPAAIDNLNFYHRNLVEPMIIDIVLVQEVPDSSYEHRPTTTLGLGKYVETVLERWVVQYEYISTVFPQVGESSASYKKTYKKSIILLRSLYSMMRLLPAYRAFRKLCLSTQASDFAINYKVSSFSVPYSREEEEVMKQYNFLPIDAPQGRLSISVTYRASLSDFNLETSTTFPPQIITDYVGSPATDPFRAFPSSEKSVGATSFPLRGEQSPSSTTFHRPHSWTCGLHRISPLTQPRGGSPPVHRASTMPYDCLSPPTNTYGPRYQNSTNHRTTSFDEYQLSPPFSPSPPTYFSGGNPLKTRMHSETAPMSIPRSMMGRSPRYLSPNMSDPNRNSLPPFSPRSTKYDPSSQDSASGIRLSRKSDSFRAGEMNSGMTNHCSSQKVLRDSKDDSGRFSGVLSSSSSPRIGFSRSSSRLSFQDDLDDFDFSCPFIVDDVDTSDSHASQNLDGKKGSVFTSQAFSSPKKSQDAAVGALVHMLRTAPPLRQDSSCYSSPSSKTELEGEVGAASGFFLSRKTSDALEELRGYKEMQDFLLSKSRTRVVGKET